MPWYAPDIYMLKVCNITKLYVPLYSYFQECQAEHTISLYLFFTVQKTYNLYQNHKKKYPLKSITYNYISKTRYTPNLAQKQLFIQIMI